MTKKRGRPAYSPSKQTREQVEMFLACGMSRDQIAAALEISLPTLDKVFATELDNGRARARARILSWLGKAARAGNVTAQKKLEEMSRLADASAEIEAATAAPAARESSAGKKKQAEAEAVATVATPTADWGDDLNPHSVN
jgi:hypothetical protein